MQTLQNYRGGWHLHWPEHFRQYKIDHEGLNSRSNVADRNGEAGKAKYLTQLGKPGNRAKDSANELCKTFAAGKTLGVAQGTVAGQGNSTD